MDLFGTAIELSRYETRCGSGLVTKDEVRNELLLVFGTNELPRTEVIRRCESILRDAEVSWQDRSDDVVELKRHIAKRLFMSVPDSESWFEEAGMCFMRCEETGFATPYDRFCVHQVWAQILQRSWFDQ